MQSLVINTGSSSVKFALFQTSTTKLIVKGKIDCIGKKLSACNFEVDSKIQCINITNHGAAVKYCIQFLTENNYISDEKPLSSIGHRVVHGGEKYTLPTKITKDVISHIKKLSKLAPLHNPANIKGIHATQKLFPQVSQYAIFDTAFHQTIPAEAFLYGIPTELYKKYHIRKYGFHGINHQWVALQITKKRGKTKKKIISCHLGNGSSITAIKNGKSIDTSMGFSPLDGLIMGTRSGSLDPEIIFYLLRETKMRPDTIEKMLLSKSGLLGISGYSDVRELRKKHLQGVKKATFALEMLSYRIAKYIGAYAAVLNGVDAIAFTGGIGEYGYIVRKMTLTHLSYLGIKIDTKKNNKNNSIISSTKSKIPIYIIPANEEKQIALEIKRIFS